MPDAKPLTSSEREALVYICHTRGGGEHWAESMLAYDATVEAAEARIEALRGALEAIAYDGYVRQIGQVWRLAIEAIEQASGDYSVTRTPEARIEALRAAADEVRSHWGIEGDPGYQEAMTHLARVLDSLDRALESQASGDYSVTRTPESAGAE